MILRYILGLVQSMKIKRKYFIWMVSHFILVFLLFSVFMLHGFHRVEAGQPAEEMLAKGLILLAIATVVVIAGSYLLVIRTLSTPFDRLVSAMTRVNDGDYTTRVDLGAAGEFGEIGEYFNTMVSGIARSDVREQQSADELEEKTLQLEKEIAERKITEEALRQAQKMEAIARLAGGVAHDFNNLLTSILGFASLTLDSLDENHPSRDDVEEIIRSGGRAQDLTTKLLMLGRKRQLDRREVDINAAVLSMVSLLRRTLGADIELVTDLSEEAGSVMADAGSLEQVVMNLAVNSRDAMPEGGKLLIRTDSKILTGTDLQHLPNLEKGSHCIMSVLDTGTGMSPGIIQHVFEPFFTTKGETTGTGLGLSTAYGIVRQCAGAIEVISTVGKGSEFRIYIPQANAESPTLSVEVDDETNISGSETILLVEDEVSVRRLTSRMLSGLGYNVLEARYGTEGLRLAQDYDGNIDLVLSDVVMPQLSGPDMIEQMHKIRSGFKVLYISGFTQDRHLRDPSGRTAQLVMKPFSRERLARKIREVLMT